MNNSFQTTNNVRPVMAVDENTIKRLLQKDAFHPMSYIKEIDIEDGGYTKYNGRLAYRLKIYIDADELFVMALEALQVEYCYLEPTEEADCSLRCDYDLMQKLLYMAVME